MKNNFTKQEKAIIAYAKKWMMPEEDLDTNADYKEVSIKCRQEIGFDMRLHVSIDGRKYMWIFDNELNKWKADHGFAEDYHY
jgi:hypothetical protein